MEYHELIEILASLARDYAKLKANPNSTISELINIQNEIVDIETQIKKHKQWLPNK